MKVTREEEIFEHTRKHGVCGVGGAGVAAVVAEEVKEVPELAKSYYYMNF